MAKGIDKLIMKTQPGEVIFREGKLDLIQFDQYTVDVGLEPKDGETRWRQPQERFLHELFNPGTSSSDVYYRGKLIAEPSGGK